MSTLPTFLGVHLVTPKGVIAHTETDALTAPGELGEMGLLPGHLPLLTSLRPGVLVIGERQKARYAVSGGYLRIDQSNTVEVLVDEAMLGKDVDVAATKAELAAAENELARWGEKPTDGEWQVQRQRAAWAQAKLDAVG